MSDLLLRIQNDLVEAMKMRDDLRLSVLRMLKSAAQMAQIEKGKDIPLTDDEVIVLVRRLIKQRNEAAEMYKSGGAQDRAQKELDEIKVLDSYLPEQMPEEEIMKIIADISSQVGASGPNGYGQSHGQGNGRGQRPRGRRKSKRSGP